MKKVQEVEKEGQNVDMEAQFGAKKFKKLRKVVKMVTWKHNLLKKVQKVEKEGQNGDVEASVDEKSSGS